MPKLVNVLEQMVMPALDSREVHQIGNKLYVPLDEDRRIEISLTTAGYAGNYEVILLKVVSKTAGELNCNGLKFRDLLGVGKMVSEDYKGGYALWRATKADLETIRQAVSEYIELWV